MEMIKQLISTARDEAKDAKMYAKYALEYKDYHRDIAELYAKLATVKVSHIDLLREQIEKMMKDKKAHDADDYPAAHAIWDWESGYIADKETEIRLMMDAYHGG